MSISQMGLQYSWIFVINKIFVMIAKVAKMKGVLLFTSPKIREIGMGIERLGGIGYSFSSNAKGGKEVGSEGGDKKISFSTYK
jgi:hypothetical protein